MDDFKKLNPSLVWGAIDEAYNAGTNPFRTAGVMTSSPAIAATLNDGAGIRTEVEAWNDLQYVESNVSNDDPTDHAVPLKMDTKLWGAVRNHRNVGVSGMNLVQDFAGMDPIAALSSRIANYRNTDEVNLFFAVLDGITKSTDAETKKLIKTMDGSFDVAQLLKAVQAAKGDNAGVVTAIGMSSANYLTLQLANLITYRAGSEQVIRIPQIADLDVIKDDRFGDRIVGMGAGLFHYSVAPQSRKPVAVESDESAGHGSGQDTVWFRWKQIIHPMGFDFTGSFTSKGGPTFADLNKAGAYTLATDSKKVPLVILKPKPTA
ncbi:hypothetical protein [Sphingomonas sp. Leaf34]|uniref:hypothetical protein n=1 Tax=Sphingomonas sp. Leaf34 TaxID=1736216 RepID=UPI0012E170A0|nr:hypothetical protein [Sphingomonas sp. Leaf34]